MVSDFKKFLLRGNLVDLSIGFTVGAAFTTVAKSLVDDILMPPIGFLLGNADFSDFYWILKPGNPGPPYTNLAAATEAGAVTVNYGEFLNSVISLLIVALAMYGVIRIFNHLNKSLQEIGITSSATKVNTKKCPHCYSKIHNQATRCPNCTSKLKTPKST